MNKIILASSSPRRKELLEKYKLNIKTIQPEIEEVERVEENPIQIAMSLAFEKAYKVSRQLNNGEVVIGADTMVVFNNKIFGKPKNREEAYEMLSLLNGKEHNVITGISIIKVNSNLKVVDYEKTKIKFRKLSKSQIERYIETGEPMDKAGGYGIQGYGEILVGKINGSYSNVVGLPVGKLDYLFKKFFDIKIL